MKRSTTTQTMLITGASGYVGTYFIESVLKSGSHHLILTGRNRDTISFLDHPRVTFLPSDLLFPETFLPIFRNHPIDQIVHLGAMARLPIAQQNPHDSILTNLVASMELLNMAVKFHVSSMLFASTDLARTPTSTLGICKYLVEDAFRLNSSSTKAIVVRLPNVIDSPGTVTLLFKKQLQQGGPITITHPNMSRRFISGIQAAEYLHYALDYGKNNQLYVNTNEAINICDLAKQMRGTLYKEVPIKFIGLKPGEQISDPNYHKKHIEQTNIHGLGRLIKNEFNINETKLLTDQLFEIVKPLQTPHLIECLFKILKELTCSPS